MGSVSFDTHRFVRRLRESGFSEPQAEAISMAFAEAQVEAELATRTDLRDLEYRLVIKLGGMLIASVAVFATLVRLS